MIIDLSTLITDSMPVHPYDNGVRVIQDKSLEKDGFNNTRLEAGMHSGTHVDAPRHFLESDLHISDYQLDSFIGNGCLLDVRGQEIIKMSKVFEEKVKSEDIVLLYTDFSKRFGTSEYYGGFDTHPLVDPELAEFFVQRRIKILGMDMPKPDNYPFIIHKMLLSSGIFIMENMVNLDKLVNVASFEVIAFPLKITAEASIVRAVARVNGV